MISLSHFNLEFDSHDDCILITPAKRQCYEDSFFYSDKFVLEALPQDVLWHFAYSTPTKTVGFQNVDSLCKFNEVEALNAPKQLRIPRSRLSAKKLADISVTLFSSCNEDNWARKDLLMAMQTEL
ncbi:Hypothetical predicted protein [Olea europaea subsp. europaea]|uniref:Uncharacterized protein n=1 Tax=Olea europaea subsp. europaea TaxID=158383 RepID=A0A8S0VE43_OLEEU|nr:Hypothetical predicted protein [Olea europaea subsp. europaea]